jgi:hypothetical protein
MSSPTYGPSISFESAFRLTSRYEGVANDALGIASGLIYLAILRWYGFDRKPRPNG